MNEKNQKEYRNYKKNVSMILWLLFWGSVVFFLISVSGCAPTARHRADLGIAQDEGKTDRAALDVMKAQIDFDKIKYESDTNLKIAMLNLKSSNGFMGEGLNGSELVAFNAVSELGSVARDAVNNRKTGIAELILSRKPREKSKSELEIVTHGLIATAPWIANLFTTWINGDVFKSIANSAGQSTVNTVYGDQSDSLNTSKINQTGTGHYGSQPARTDYVSVESETTENINE